MRIARTVTFLGAAVAVAACPSPRPSEGPAAATRFERRRAVHGVVLTPDGEPLPGVVFKGREGELCESNAFGEFSWFTDAIASRCVAVRPPFADEELDLSAGPGDVEHLVRFRRAAADGSPA